MATEILLACWIPGTDGANAFLVDILLSKTVGHLRAAIKKKKEPVLNHIDADQLEIWKLSNPLGSRDIAKTLGKIEAGDKVPDADKLDSVEELSDYFSEAPVKRMVHIVVLVPPAKQQPISVDMATEISLVCWIPGTDGADAFPVDILLSKTVGHLKDAIKEKNEPVLNHIDANQLEIWKLTNPLSRNEASQKLGNLRRVPRRTNIPGGEWLDPLGDLSRYFPEPPAKKKIHLVVQVPTPDDTKEIIDIFSKSQTKGALNDITVHVDDIKTWAEGDISKPLNCIVKLWEDDTPDTHLDGVRSKLDEKRVLSDVREPESNMVSRRELDALNNAVTNYMNWVESIKVLSSSLKDDWLKSALVSPLMLELVDSCRRLKQGYSFNGDVGWGFSILVDSGHGQPLLNFAPRPDFILLPCGFCPIVLGEIVSDTQNESDRWRMLLQLAVCARMNGLLVKTNDPPLVVQAIYLSNEYKAERYLAYAETKNDSAETTMVRIARDTFDVTTRNGIVRFLRSMYNLKSIVMDADSMWDKDKEQLCAKLSRALKKLPSLSTQRLKAKSKSASARMPPIAEHASDLTRQGYQISQFSTTHQHIAYATTPSEVVVLKCIDNGRAYEIHLLEFLHRTSTPDNHTIPFTSVLRTGNDTVISMPYYQPLDKWHPTSVSATALLGTQLLEAVGFLHARGVVHRDLKPENVVIDVDPLRLFIIDYDLATWVYGRDETLYGFVGTDGFTAPEVGNSKQKGGYYSPIAADLWATGNILRFVTSCVVEHDPQELKMLRLVSGLLMDYDAKQRPSAKEALNMLLGGATSAPPLPVPGNAGGLPSAPAIPAVH